jgi:type I restriction enzyme M protein
VVEKFLVVPKEKIAANGDYNLSGERYREGAAQSQTYPSYPLSEVCDIFNGSTPSKQEPRYWDNGTVPWFTVEDIRKGGRIVEKTEKFVTDAGLNETSLKLLPKHSVLLCCTASVGEYAFTEIEVTTNQQFNGLVVNKAFAERLLPKFLFLISSRFKEELIRLSGKTAFNFVSVGTLKTIGIPLPPLEVQKEIVAEIEGYQKVINGARAVLDHYRPHIPIRPDWPSEQLGKLCMIRTGKKDVNSGNPAGKYPFFTCAREHTYSDVWSFDCEAILVAGNGDVGAVQYYQGKFEAYQRTYVLSDWVGVGGRYLYFCLDGPLKDTVSKLKQGNTMPYIKLGMLSEFQVPLPPLATQQAIVAEIEAEQALVAANRELITRFDKKIQATLARIWGEDEPAWG